MIVDEIFGTTGQGYRLTRIHHLGEHTVRIDIRYDTYAQQSHATAEVLSTGQTWTTLLSDPPSNWHDTAPSPYARPAPTAKALYPLAEQLARRAATVLRTPPPATTPPPASQPPATRGRRTSTTRTEHGRTR